MDPRVQPTSPQAPSSPLQRDILSSLQSNATTSMGNPPAPPPSSYAKVPPAPQISLNRNRTSVISPLKVEVGEQDPAILALAPRPVPTPTLPGLLQLPGTYNQAPRPPIHPAPPTYPSPQPLLKFSFAASRMASTPRMAVYDVPSDAQIVVAYNQDNVLERSEHFMIATGWLWSATASLIPYWCSSN